MYPKLYFNVEEEIQSVKNINFYEQIYTITSLNKFY